MWGGQGPSRTVEPRGKKKYKIMAEETMDVHVEDGENSFKMFIGFNFKQLL
jgi:hypothetical protein